MSFHPQGMMQELGLIARSREISHNLPVLLPSSGKFFSVKLPSPLAPGAKVRVSVEMVFTHVLQPYPTHITQSEKQFVVFEGNHYFYSPYFTKTQTTRVKLASRNVESYTKLGNPSRTEDTIEYGPFKDIPPYSQVRVCAKRLWLCRERLTNTAPASQRPQSGKRRLLSENRRSGLCHLSAESFKGVSLWDMEMHNCEGRLLLTACLIVYLFCLLGHPEGAL